MKEVSPSWTISALQTLSTLYTSLFIGNPHIQTNSWTGIPTTQYLQKGLSFKHLSIGPRWYAPPLSCYPRRWTTLTRFCTGTATLTGSCKKPNHRPHMDQTSNQETIKESFVTAPYIQGLSEEFRRIFKDTKVQIIIKGYNILKTLIMLPKDKIPTQLCQDVVHQWTCANENCILLTLENQAYAEKAGLKNTISHVLVQYSNIAQPKTTLKLIYINLKSLTQTESRFPERLYIKKEQSCTQLKYRQVKHS